MATKKQQHLALVILALCVVEASGFSPSRFRFGRPLDGSLRVSSQVNGNSAGSTQQQYNGDNSNGVTSSAASMNPYRTYSDYLSRLWRETNPLARKKIADNKEFLSVKHTRDCVRGDAFLNDSVVSMDHRQNLLDACDTFLEDTKSAAAEETVPVVDVAANGKPKEKKRRSVSFGATMGAIVACWVFSGNFIFTGLFTLMTIAGQLEYYRMVMNTGVFPARRISVIGAAAMFLTASVAPSLHQVCLPMFGLFGILQLLSDRDVCPSITDVATTFTGMFYLGYCPSFWCRIRLLGPLEPTRFLPMTEPLFAFLKQNIGLLAFLPKALPVPVTGGAIFIFWSWLSLAFSDVGAYFVGRKFGKTKLSSMTAAAGKTSPNKSVEGVLGGCVVSAALSTLGAWAQRWPLWPLTGAVHGLILGFLGFVGDLTASMLKRDAGLKDFGDLIPEHGGILDRVDSFVWTAPYSWLVCSTILPALRSMTR
ncbi:Phosphatidate cytidylyltransferase [Seminavis robusta]|uniref:Phosphatidate cytidylyltransferase n=1 Tax=Seminavis robusta TaxID=568900 RepID=A0A9N8EU48_9STRA|nr:Phosphatidate cytidylyltransferase [Seminavis robusta]|eukprot:Sro1693_g291620.1 Phosphatidate cytidylyltransferase (479) ;mRNA; f:2956-4523